MRVFDWQVVRFVFVLALGGGVAALASQPDKPKVAVKENPAPIILAIAVERAPQAEVGARVDQCSLNPRDYSDGHVLGDKSAKDSGKRKIVVCG